LEDSVDPLRASVHPYKEIADPNGGYGTVISEYNLDGFGEQSVLTEPVAVGAHDVGCP
jgi:hypothetical protein